MEFISHSEAETEALGEKLARSLPEHGVVIAMYGELGAGKTAFVRGLARGLEVDGAVTSPTFTIVNELYGKRDLFHFDMYRLGSGTSFSTSAGRITLTAAACAPWSGARMSPRHSTARRSA